MKDIRIISRSHAKSHTKLSNKMKYLTFNYCKKNFLKKPYAPYAKPYAHLFN